MNARDTSPPEGNERDGESDGSIAASLVEDHIQEIDRHADRAGTEAIRAGRADLLEELTEHLEGIAEWLQEEGEKELEEQGALALEDESPDRANSEEES